MRSPKTLTTVFDPNVGYVHTLICDDGSLWNLQNIYNGWQKLPDVPQDEIEEFKCKMCRDKGWIAGPGDSHPCPNCAILNVSKE